MSNDSDDDFGPLPLPDNSGEHDDGRLKEEELKSVPQKKKRRLDHEQSYIDALPDSKLYEKSYMHRDVVTHVCVARQTDFLVTGSADGHVKLWKKMSAGVEFVKHFLAHLGRLHALEVSPDGLRAVTTGADGMVKFFDVQSFDMTNMILTTPTMILTAESDKLPPGFLPGPCAWLIEGSSRVYSRVAVADMRSGAVRVYRADEEGNQYGEVALHAAPVVALRLCLPHRVVISVDAKGIIEYWDSETYAFPSKKQGVSFEHKTDTDLYAVAKSRSLPTALAVSPTGKHFVLVTADRLLRVFDFSRGRVTRTYDESLQSYRGAVEGMDPADLLRRQAVEKELLAQPQSLALCNVVFDDSGFFIAYASLVGIKVVNIVTNKLARLVGGSEVGDRFTAVALYQGVPKVDNQFLLSRAGATAKSTEEMAKLADTPDPTIYAASFQKRRFYCFSNRAPDETEEARDVFNELPTEEERQAEPEALNRNLGREAVLRTNHGDIYIKLFAAECPKTIENFCTHARNGYYDGTVFHRVIKGFMVQCGDPLGDGTGGESIWGGEFEDEFARTLRHDRAYTLSMANAGPNTNGSQFFITTVPTPWLDSKHTVFGRVTKGFEVVSNIENLKTNKLDKPVEGDPKILSIDILL